MSPGPATFADGQPHSFACWLNQNTLVAELDGQQGTVDTSQVNNVGPSGRFSTEVTFGKKPDPPTPKTPSRLAPRGASQHRLTAPEGGGGPQLGRLSRSGRA